MLETVVLGLITARGGSKGVPGKNIKVIADKPMITWTIEAAIKSTSLSRVIVSTDDKDIAQISLQSKAEVPFMRPNILAEDDSPHIDTVIHAVEWMVTNENYNADYIMLLQPTSPMRTARDIDDAISIALEKDLGCVISVCESKSHPNFTWSISEDGSLTNFLSKPKEYLRRQTLKPAYAQNGAIFLIRQDILLKEKTLYASTVFPYIMPQERSLEVDDSWDMYLADLIMRNMKSFSGENDKP